MIPTEEEIKQLRLKSFMKRWRKKTGGCNNLNHFWHNKCNVCNKEIEL